MAIKLTFLGGELGYDVRVDDYDMLAPATHIGSMPRSREIVAKLRVYLDPDDVVREYDVKGVTGNIRQFEPSLEDRQHINAVKIAGMLTEHGLDVHDFKQIIEMALMQTYDKLPPTELARTLDKIHHDLGGLQ